MNKHITPEILKSRQHFEILDGLRGIAALAIVIFHFMEWIYTDPSKNFIGHGFLAVDFFFCLSGFVIAYAYDSRIGEMGIIEFFKSRVIRLHPLVVLGAILGLLGFLFDPFSGHPEVYSAGKLILIFVCSIFLIPYPVMPDRSFNVFGLNAPSWSLFWEYVANIVYALILHKLPRRALIVLTLIAAVILCSVGLRAGNLLGGWNGETFWDGGARILYSFSAGLLIYRSNWITELLIVLVYFPLLVSLGAGSSLSSGSRKLCTFSGDISYPLYMTHYAVIWIFGNYLASQKPESTELTIVVILGTIFLTGFAYATMVLYDIPFRRYLNNKRLKSLKP